MGMPNMQVQQPMQQSGGKGMASSQLPGQQASFAQDDARSKMANLAGIAGPGPLGLGAGGPAPNTALQSINQEQLMAANQANMERQALSQPGGMGGMKGEPSGKGGFQRMSQGGQQPRFGQPNNYPNTIRPWDNSSIMPQQGGGKIGKGGGQSGGYPIANTNTKYTPPQQTAPTQMQQSAPTQTPFQGY
jgi:hypothetical protein